MNYREYCELKQRQLNQVYPYKMEWFDDFDYAILSNIPNRKRQGRGSNNSYNDCIIMADTETSKKECWTIIDKEHKVRENHVVAWTMSIRAVGRNIVTLYGKKPSDFAKTVKRIMENLQGFETIIYFHNMSYDWHFLRQFMFSNFGFPDKQLNIKSHYPILIKWECGLVFKDSLILAQRSIQKWSKDMNVEHQKAVGKWDYDKIRHQSDLLNAGELEYIECDTLAGVECIDALLNELDKTIATVPYTATGIPREAVRKIGKQNRAREWFMRQHLTYEQQQIAEMVYHGGYTHSNRHLINWIQYNVRCKDFASSYPFTILSEKFPCEGFMDLDDCNAKYIIDNKDDYAFMFKFVAIDIHLKDDFIPMPILQFSKCVNVINAIQDNGRILKADYVEIFLTEQDLDVILKQYKYSKHICTQVLCACKNYLPRWFTDYVFKCFEDKTTLKGGDPVSYALAKAKLNSLYGMCVQKPIKQDMIEDYLTGDYIEVLQDPAELYNKYLNNRNTILPYQIGVWVTAYAMHNLFELGECIDYDNGNWLYSDTDSIYSDAWDEDKVKAYNQKCKDKLIANNYGCVMHNNREYWLGVAEDDAFYSEYVTQGSKRYCGRGEDGKLNITVAGVPKVGAKCLNNDIKNFTKGFIFDGATTGKLTHTYYYNNDGIYIDKDGNETADSIDLTSCDYLLDSVNVVKWDDIDMETIEIQVYDEEDLSGRI